jgi:hypothetical protein
VKLRILHGGFEMKDYLMEYAGRADALLIAKFGKKSLETCQS